MEIFNVRVEDSDGNYVAIKPVEAESKDKAVELAQKEIDANVNDYGYRAVRTQAKRSK